MVKFFICAPFDKAIAIFVPDAPAYFVARRSMPARLFSMLVSRESYLVRNRTMNAAVSEDALLSGIAMAIGEPARMRILLSLLDGHARTSTELAAIAEVNPSTASAHLNRLRETRLIRVAAQGRYKYYSLRGPDVARVLESLSVLAGGTTEKFVPSTPESLRKARSCYDHMAGAVAVTLHDQFLREGWLIPNPGSLANAYEVSSTGAREHLHG
jgi:DNA-binding transcriptional ArsR family regulator